jgi:AraC family transcriptional regulator
MKPRILDKGETLLVGMSFFGDPFQMSGAWTEENEIGRLWNRFMAFVASEGERIKHVRCPSTSVEAHVYGDDALVTGTWEIFIGVEVGRLEDVPLELVVKVLPASTYAVFTLEGEAIGGDWNSLIYTEWMPDSGYEMAHSYAFQYYDERFKGVDDLANSVLDVYIPVKRVKDVEVGA